MCCVMFVSTLGFLSDGEDKIDSRSAPGNRGGPASAECCRGEFPSSQRGDVREVFLYSSLNGPEGSLVSGSGLSFSFSGYSVMLHIWGWALCVQNHK